MNLTRKQKQKISAIAKRMNKSESIIRDSVFNTGIAVIESAISEHKQIYNSLKIEENFYDDSTNS